ncbi:hypothetical protein TRIUR3_05764 [Triticum urartu]|uniref:Telomere length regulation protein conserved domain-containing protein n=1 Tax=Triticum urartu TaxID=4572 RepID=M7ZD05_TRIUA|nr:hypothetical protein TRIUR3_05764 [Triticum urartu]
MQAGPEESPLLAGLGGNRGIGGGLREKNRFEVARRPECAAASQGKRKKHKAEGEVLFFLVLPKKTCTRELQGRRVELDGLGSALPEIGTQQLHKLGLCIFNDPSLEPYDLSDDDTNLQKNFTHLSDLAAALRKYDHRDGVESALSSAEKLVRASPDELCHCSGDLVQARVHVPCSRVKVEGEEDSAEENRQKALVALLFRKKKVVHKMALSVTGLRLFLIPWFFLPKHEQKLMDVSASPEGDAPCNMKNTIWTKGRYKCYEISGILSYLPIALILNAYFKAV